MRPVGPPGSGARMQRSVAACLASILELEVARVPLPDEWHPQPWTVWRQWLGQRGLGLVPIADPANFHWPGPWLAMVRGAEGGGLVAAGAGGGWLWGGGCGAGPPGGGMGPRGRPGGRRRGGFGVFCPPWRGGGWGTG